MPNHSLATTPPLDNPRCPWCNLQNPLYIKYHDTEWGVPNFNDDRYLFEMLLLETFQAGLSWECVLNKRSAFRQAFDNFDPIKISRYTANSPNPDSAKAQTNQYTAPKITELLKNPNIIRNRRKILAAVHNAQIFLQIQREFGSFHAYLKTFTADQIIYEFDRTTSPLSDAIAQDLKSRGMQFVGSTTIYAYLQAIGIINSHSPECFLYKESIL